jgi:hypothetical protein
MRRRASGGARFLDRREDRHEMREPADRKDLVHDRVEANDCGPPRSLGFCRKAVINARKPALEIYSTAEKSITTSAELEVTAASSRV